MKNARERPRAFRTAFVRSLDAADVRGARTLRAVDDVEPDAIALGQALEAITLNRGVMHEHVGTTLTREESETLGVVEPLDGTFDHLDVGLLRPSLVCDVLARPCDAKAATVANPVEKRRSNGNETDNKNTTGRRAPSTGARTSTARPAAARTP